MIVSSRLIMRSTLLLFCLILPSCASNFLDFRMASIVKDIDYGTASWYSRATNSPPNSGTTASGIELHDDHSVAAHRTLPFGTMIRVTNLANGKSEVVKVIDRGPYKKGRIIDVSVGCAKRLGFHHKGLTKVRLEVFELDD